MSHSISRRDFLKLAGAGLGALAVLPYRRVLEEAPSTLPDFPRGVRLGRNCTGGWINIMAQPNFNARKVRVIYEDTLLEWLREVVGTSDRTSQRWVETPEGYVYAPFMQPVQNLPNQPLTQMPAGVRGFWAEVTVPYVDLFIDNPLTGGRARSPWANDYLARGAYPRLYYNQVVWIDDIRVNAAGTVLYRYNEKVGSYGDIYWAEGAAFRPLTSEELAPINPDVDPAEKRILVDNWYQTLTCLEGKREVFFCRVSTGARWDAYGNKVDAYATPLGEHITWRKIISTTMSGNATGRSGYDQPGIPWTILFSGTGVAIHAAFWHNDFGTPRSHGCVNARPEDAKWIFRWSLPTITLDQDDITMIYPDGGTRVVVSEPQV